MLKSNFKKLISCFLIIMMTITGNSVVHADESSNLSNQTISKEEFDKFKLDGVYGDDVTYEDILNALQISNQSNLDSTYNPYKLSRASYTPKKGDFVVTSDPKTASGGIIGHAGIFIDSSTILHIAGSKTSSVTTLSWSSWKASYTKNRVFRVPNNTVADNAANWAISKYRGKSPGYKITMDLTTTSPTYCSKIVWQAFYYGTGSTNVIHNTPLHNTIIMPGSLPNAFNSTYSPNLVFSN